MYGILETGSSKDGHDLKVQYLFYPEDSKHKLAAKEHPMASNILADVNDVTIPLKTKIQKFKLGNTIISIREGTGHWPLEQRIKQLINYPTRAIDLDTIVAYLEEVIHAEFSQAWYQAASCTAYNTYTAS